MQYGINLGAWNAVFAVPSAVVDKHLKLAGSAQLKALLWLLRHAGEQTDADDVASAIGLSRLDTMDALQYWVEAGLLCPVDDGYAPAASPSNEGACAPSAEQSVQSVSQLVSASSKDKTEPSVSAAASQAKGNHVPAPSPKPDSREVLRRATECEDIAFLLQETQIRFGRPLSPAEISTLVWLHDYNGLPTGVILMIIEFAQSREKCSMRYIEKMAINWADEEIDTLEKAERKLAQIHTAQCNWNKICTAFGIPSRSPSARETAYIQRWMQDWSFSMDIIRMAYEQCVNYIGKLDFSYINKVLERWHKANVKTPKDAVAVLNKGKSNQAKNALSGPASFDLDAYERMTQVMPGVKKEE
nr:DnaD domain protein [uncultured Solibaculum sp.]